jgi:hypothetical protein
MLTESDNMRKRTHHKKSKFRYWQEYRNNKSQVAIAEEYEVSRQTVNRAISTQKSQVLKRLLNNALSLNLYNHWVDDVMGVLFATAPHLGNILCILLVDHTDNMHVFFDYKSEENDEIRKQFISLVNQTFNLAIDLSASFKEIIQTLNSRRNTY